LNYQNSIAGLIFFLVAAGCAQQGSPSGGPKDETPPAVVSSSPANYSNHFKATKAEIVFDEYLVLDNVNQQLIISPPLEEKPVIKLKGKTLQIEIPGELRENTTYTFNFGNAIKDLHEGNKLQNFEYVFSTGETVDSLSVRGSLTYAFDLKTPKEPMYIMLYGDLRDSIPLIEPPFYIGRSDDKGNFSVNNLRPGVYKVFALKDANNNFLFDLPTEEIAFLDSNLIVSAEYFKSIFEARDSVSNDSLPDYLDMKTGKPLTRDFVSKDSLPDKPAGDIESIADSTAAAIADSIRKEREKYNYIVIDLSVFTEETSVQYLSDHSRKDKRKLDLVFNKPLTDSFKLKALHPEMFPAIWYISQFSAHRDTVAFWMPDSLIYQKDTIETAIFYTVTDSVGNPYSKTDTISFAYREPSSKNKKKATTKPEFSIKTITKGAQQELNKKLSFTANVPVSGFDPGKIFLFNVVDSTETPVDIQVKRDSIRMDRINLSNTWESGAAYHLFVLPGAVSGIFGDENDTIDVTFKSRETEYYGNLSFDLENVTVPVIVELYTGDKLAASREIKEAGRIVFNYMKPQTYKVKFILDRNNNGKWDTGKYMKKIQPEKVEWFPKEIEIRSNWDQEEHYTFK